MERLLFKIKDKIDCLKINGFYTSNIKSGFNNQLQKDLLLSSPTAKTIANPFYK